jgi:hypothetical protein
VRLIRAFSLRIRSFRLPYHVVQRGVRRYFDELRRALSRRRRRRRDDTTAPERQRNRRARSTFNDRDWGVIGTAEVREETGAYRPVRIYRLKEFTSHVCIFFGNDEYEGLTSPYSFVEHVLKDDDGIVIPSRNFKVHIQ